QIAQALAAFLKLPYRATINPEEIRLEMLPAAYCRTNLVVAIRESSGENALFSPIPWTWTYLTAFNERLARTRNCGSMLPRRLRLPPCSGFLNVPLTISPKPVQVGVF